MKKIYLAISEEESLGIKPVLYKKIPNSEILFISDQEIEEVLSSSFHMLIVPSHKIDLSEINTSDLAGTLVILDPSHTESFSVSRNVDTYNSIDNFKVAILTKDLENQDLKIENNTLSLKQNFDHGEEKAQHKEPSTQKNEVRTFEGSKLTKETRKAMNNVNETEEGNLSKPVNLEVLPSAPFSKEDPILSLEPEHELKTNRAKLIRENNFNFGKWKGNKIIGVWSPLATNGVSTFVMNYAMFLSDFDIDIMVLEPLKKDPVLKSKLTRYQSVPDNWVSFFEALHNEELDINLVKWFFRGVYWLPLQKNDYLGEKWTNRDINEYMKNLKKCDIGFVDLPSKEIESFTVEVLKHLDELWIIIDNRYDQTLEEIEEFNRIRQYSSTFNFATKLIVTRCPDEEWAKDLAKELDFPLIGVLPSMDAEIQMSERGHKPLLDYFRSRKKLTPIFEVITTHLLGSYFDKYKPTPWKRMKRILSKG